MSLFVGNLSKNVRSDDLSQEFESFGRCKCIVKGSFAFVDFENDGDAEKAMKELINKDMGGLKINIEWSKKSRNFDPEDSSRPEPKRRKNQDDVKCFNCEKRGHFARDCKSRKRSRDRYDRRSRSRSPRRDRRDGGRDGDRDRRGRDRSPRRRYDDSRSDSRSRRYGRRDYRDDDRGDRRDRRSPERGSRNYDRRDDSRDKDQKRDRSDSYKGRDNRRNDRSKERFENASRGSYKGRREDSRDAGRGASKGRGDEAMNDTFDKKSNREGGEIVNDSNVEANDTFDKKSNKAETNGFENKPEIQAKSPKQDNVERNPEGVQAQSEAPKAVEGGAAVENPAQ